MLTALGNGDIAAALPPTANVDHSVQAGEHKPEL